MSRRSSRKAEVTIVDDNIKSSPVPPRTPPKGVKLKVESSETVVAISDKPSKPIIKRVKAKSVLEASEPSTTKSGKRKVKTEDGEETADSTQTKKKRKTKEEKEAEAMPLAARTAVGSLEKLMHIGAHVSAAGG